MIVATSKAVAAVLFVSVLAIAPLHAADTVTNSEDGKVFYYLGTAMGRNLKTLALSPAEVEAVVKGLRAGVVGEEEQLDDALYTQKINEMTQQRIEMAAAEEAALSLAYVEAMAAEEGAHTTPSGLVYLEQQAGTGVQAQATSSVTAHYTGTLRDGSVFDSSYQRGRPLTIPLSSVIPCWTEAIAMMKVGGKSKLTCPAELAYGDNGSGAIGPGAAVTFEVELLAIVQ